MELTNRVGSFIGDFGSFKLQPDPSSNRPLDYEIISCEMLVQLSQEAVLTNHIGKTLDLTR